MNLLKYMSLNDKSSSIPTIPNCLKAYISSDGWVSYDDSQNEIHLTTRSAAHVFIWAHTKNNSSFGNDKAAIMMQLRFDGTFGFAGGLIDFKEDIVDGLMRELEEEIGWDSSLPQITMKDLFSCRVVERKQLMAYFFVKEISYKDFVDLEKRALSAKDYGDEVLGIVRVPTYTMYDRKGGLPSFLNNSFVANAKYQLLWLFIHLKLFTEKEVEEMLVFSNTLLSKKKVG